jgi:hypothetical protein
MNSNYKNIMKQKQIKNKITINFDKEKNEINDIDIINNVLNEPLNNYEFLSANMVYKNIKKALGFPTNLNKDSCLLKVLSENDYDVLSKLSTANNFTLDKAIKAAVEINTTELCVCCDGKDSVFIFKKFYDSILEELFN